MPDSCGAVVTSHLPLQHLALVTLACGLALLINPYGARLLYFPFAMQADWIRANGAEWQSPWRNPVWQEVGGGQVLPLEPVFWVYMAVLGGVLLAAARRWRTADLVPVAVMGLWAVMSVRHLRAVGDAVVLTTPFVAAAITSHVFLRRSYWPQRIGDGPALGVALTSMPFTVSHSGSELDDVDPAMACASAMIERHGSSGRLFAHAYSI
jgi:hypothetical protein